MPNALRDRAATVLSNPRLRRAVVTASDIAGAMAAEAQRRAAELGLTSASFEASDLESVSLRGRAT